MLILKEMVLLTDKKLQSEMERTMCFSCKKFMCAIEFKNKINF